MKHSLYHFTSALFELAHAYINYINCLHRVILSGNISFLLEKN